MNYRIHNLNRPIDSEVAFYEEAIEKLTGLKKGHYTWRRHRESIDARKGRTMQFTATVDIVTKKKLKTNKKITAIKEEPYDLSPIESDGRPIIVGAGPAGLFCAYVLAMRGVKPIILERGDRVEERVKCVESFWNGGELDTESNVQFGEGGAGTFSDGKLTSRSKDPRGRFVLELFSRLAKDESILYKKKPHVGTDALRRVLIDLRRELEAMGAEFHFRTRFDSFSREGDKFIVETSKGNVEGDYIVLALGHSARDTFEYLEKADMAMESKPFAVGFRIESDQGKIDENQYGDMCGYLPAADYQVSAQIDGRGVYSFCMCPGGKVVASQSEEHTIVTNGMSYKARDGKNANAAILVTIDESIYGEGIMAGVEFQRMIEKKAYDMSGSYKAPTQSVASYLEEEDENTVEPTYMPGTYAADLHSLYPKALDDMLTEGLRQIGGYFPALTQGAILTAPETRSSSPVRLTRDKKSLESLHYENIYPAGEGAGYAGGIVSSAIDGMRVSEKIIEKEKNYVRN